MSLIRWVVEDLVPSTMGIGIGLLLYEAITGNRVRVIKKDRERTDA